MGRMWRTVAAATTLTAVALYASTPSSPAAHGACEQTVRHWSELNAWSSDAILKPFAILLKAC